MNRPTEQVTSCELLQRLGAAPAVDVVGLEEELLLRDMSVVDVGGGGDCFFLAMAALMEGTLTPSAVQAATVRQDVATTLAQLDGRAAITTESQTA